MITYGATYCHRLWTFLGGLELLSRLATWNYWRSQHDRYWRDKQHAPMRSVGIAIIAVFYCGVMHAHFQGSTDATFYMVPVAWSVFLSFYNGQHEGSRTSACYVQIGPLGLCLSFFFGGYINRSARTYHLQILYGLYISKFYLLYSCTPKLHFWRGGKDIANPDGYSALCLHQCTQRWPKNGWIWGQGWGMRDPLEIS